VEFAKLPLEREHAVSKELHAAAHVGEHPVEVARHVPRLRAQEELGARVQRLVPWQLRGAVHSAERCHGTSLGILPSERTGSAHKGHLVTALGLNTVP
jgi:hypothetical protein